MAVAYTPCCAGRFFLAGGTGRRLAIPAAASTAERPPQTQIVGGTVAPPAYGWTAALIRRGASRTGGFACGAVVLSRSWVLTAGHCVLDYDNRYPDATYGRYVGPSHYDVLTGTRSLTGSGGQRLQVAAVYPHPSYDAATNDFDVALLRLARPTPAGAVAVIGSSPSELALNDAGVTATVSGWGTTSSAESPPPSATGVPIQSMPRAATRIPGFTKDENARVPRRTGSVPAPSGGKDSCRETGGLWPAGR